MYYVIRNFQIRSFLVLSFFAISAGAQQMQMFLLSPQAAGKPVKAIIEAGGLNGMYTARCTIYIDTAVLHSSEATITSGISNLLVSGGFGSSSDTILLTSTLIDSSSELTQGTLAAINFPVMRLSSNYSSAIHIIGASLELRTGEIVQMDLHTSMVRIARNHNLRIDNYFNKKNTDANGKIFDIRGREMYGSVKIQQFYDKKWRVNLSSPSGLSHQVLIYQ